MMSELKLPEYEADVVDAMLRVADKYSLTVEVVLSFANVCVKKKPVSVDDYAKCSFIALGEWIK